MKHMAYQLQTKRLLQKKTGVSIKAQERIIKKGKGAYYSSGSRPGQSASSWAYARLASVIMGGKAKKYDQHITTYYHKITRYTPRNNKEKNTNIKKTKDLINMHNIE